MDGKTEDQTKNNKPWLFQPGESGNPGGRPKGTFSIRRLIAERVQQNPEEAKQIIDAVYRRALADNDSKEFKYIETIIESVDGKLTQPIGGDPNRPIVVVTNIPGLEIKTDTAERADNSVQESDS